MDKLIKTVSVTRDNNKLSIMVNKTTNVPISLYWTKKTDANTLDKTLISLDIKEITYFDDPLENKERIYFILDLNDKKTKPYLFGERTLKLAGMTNLRDCGGYLGANGKRIKWGILYRSNHLYSLAGEALDYVKKLHIQTIIDYRSDNEIKKSPNQYIGEKQTIHLDASAHTAELAAQFAAKPNNENRDLIQYIINHISQDKINGNGEQVLEQYRNFVMAEQSKRVFKQMLITLLDKNNSPSLQHCRGGKDRTGYGVLLVMIMLGVSKQDITKDYMLTKENRLDRNNDKIAEYKTITQDKNILAYLLSLIDTREVFIQEVFKSMEELAGTPENYIKQELGFSDNDFITMQNNFLE